MNDSPVIRSLESSRCLITGGAGFIGSHIARTLLALGADVHILDDFSSGHRVNVPHDAVLFEGSILDRDKLREAIEGCRFVFHEAAMVSVPQSVDDPTGCVQTNVVGTELVLEAARNARVERLVFAASAAAYGNEPRLPSDETDPPDARSPYAASKLASEQLIRAHACSYGLSAVSLRYFNVFGPRQDPKSPYAAVISAFIDRLSRGEGVTIFGDGEQTRDFIYIDDVVRANLLAAVASAPLAGEIINIGTGNTISLKQLEAELRAIFPGASPPTFADARAGDVRHSRANVKVARDLLGFEARVGVAAGLRQTADWAANGKAAP